jgi:hypothetical protein
MHKQIAESNLTNPSSTNIKLFIPPMIIKYMTKREYDKMSRKEVRDQYNDIVTEIYMKRGPLAAAKYELDAIYHTALTAIKNFIDDGKNPAMDTHWNYHHPQSYAGLKRKKTVEKMQERRERNREHILRGLEKTTATMVLLSFAGGMIFISPTMTGNTIANITPQTISLFGSALFLVAIVGSFAWVKLRKNSKP